MRLRIPRGLRDVEPEEYRRISYLYRKFEERAREYGYSLMEPSTIELFETVCKKSGPDIKNEIYVFRDKSGRELALRFDLTVGLTRYVVSNPQLALPVKLAAFSVMWRYDEPQFGRYRCFYQWDVEIFGADQVMAGGEVVDFSYKYLNSLKIKDIEIRISSRRIMDRIITKFLPSINPTEVMRIIDKRDKIGLERVKELIKAEAKEEKRVEKLIELISRPYSVDEAEKAVKKIDPEIAETDEFRNMMRTAIVAESLGAKNILIDFSVVRGLDYYDDVVFEVMSRSVPEVGAIVGGGSFSTLPRALGRDITAFGAAGGVERTLIAMEKLGINIPAPSPTGLFIAYVDKQFLSYALRAASRLRSSGVPCEVDLTGRKMDRQLKYAEKRGYRYVGIIGAHEAERGTISLKDFVTGEQVELTLDALLREFSQK